MGRDLQKRKRRSSRPAIRQPSSRRVKLRNPAGSDVVAQAWDKNETQTQNYRRLGLVQRLQRPTGGAEPDYKNPGQANRAPAKDAFAVHAPDNGVVTEVRVERDASGKIVKILGGADGKRRRRDNPLNDPLNDLDTDSENEEFQDDGETWGGIDAQKEDTRTEVVRQLEAEAARPREKKVRTQSQREVEWLESLVEAHGADTRSMAKDRKLNPMQQTEADIARRLRKLEG
ncbi:Nucleolar protein 16 [Pestalotiopsis sp. 9143b]|nr:Nucleolar protein 16 [Pestalotiopsis sp. 9143b]